MSPFNTIIKVSTLVFVLLALKSNCCLAQANLLQHKIHEPVINNQSTAKFIDVNFDGSLDIVIASISYGFNNSFFNKLVVILNQLDGTFHKTLTYTPPEHLFLVDIIDYDKDGDFDIIVKNTNRDVLVIEQHCFMNFTAPQTLGFDMHYTNHNRSAHFNKNKYIDYIANYYTELRIHANTDNAKFKSQISLYADNNLRFVNYSTHDLNKDDAAEIVAIANNSSYYELLIYANDGEANFSKIVLDTFDNTGSTNTKFITSFIVDDIDEDGLDDVFFTTSNLDNIGSIYVLKNKGNFIFEKEPIKENIKSMLLTKFKDLDNDQLKDLWLSNRNAAGSNYLKNVAGNFTAPIPFVENFPSINIDANPQLDFVTVYKNILISNTNFDGWLYESNCNTLNYTLLNGNYGHFINVKDINNNGSQDVILGNTYSNEDGNFMLSFLENDGQGNFHLKKGFNLADENCNEASFIKTRIEGIEFEDLNNDGIIDILHRERKYITSLSIVEEANYFISYGNAYGFNKKRLDTSITHLLNSHSYVQFVDLDNSNGIDIIASKDSTIYYYQNDGHGKFTRIKQFESNKKAYAIFDFDNNGFKDIVLNAYDTNLTPFIYFNLGGLLFESNRTFNNNDSIVQTKQFIDFNNDNFYDIVTLYKLGSDSTHYDFYLNNGNNVMNFTASTTLLNYQHINNFFDYDLDGFIDIMMLNSDNYYVCLNDGNFNFTNTIILSSIERNSIRAFHDFDKDSDIDFLATAGYDVDLFKNQTIINNPTAQDTVSNVNILSSCTLFNLPSTFERVEMQIFNLQGQQINTQFFENTNSIKIDFKAAKGMYIAKLKTSTGEEFNYKIIK